MSDMRMTWEECCAAGMSQAEAARARGMSKSAAGEYAKRHGLVFADGIYSPSRRQAASERMRARMADPVQRERAGQAVRERHADPARNPLLRLTPAERADYDLFKLKGCTREEAFRLIGRVDLVEMAA